MRVDDVVKFVVVIICLGFQSVRAQSFTSNASANIPANFGYLSNTINVTGLGNLDGTTIGVVSIELSMTAGTTVNGNTIYNEIEIYLEAPDRHAVYIMDNDLSVANKTFVFSNDPNAAFFKYVQFNNATPINNPYSPAVSFNALNQGQSANGTWRLYAKKSVALAPATINSWKITFGTTNLTSGAPNQTCSTALPLPNTTLTGNSVSGTNSLNGIVVADSRGSEVGSSGLTETSIWYSFVPKCKNDTIQITGKNSYIQSGILGGTCGARSVLRSYKDLFNITYNYLYPNYTPGNTYFLVMDGSQADVYQYQIKWFKGSVGCIQTNTLTTGDVANSMYCAGDSIYVPLISTGTFASSNRFTAQLSDASGSFSTPQTIGYLEGANGTSVKSKLPINLTTGTGYKVRVVSTDPVVTGSVSPIAFEVKNRPSTPIALNGKTTVCSNETDLPYSVSPVADATHYKWTVASAVQITSSVPDSASISISSWPMANTISVQSVNVCGSSAALQKSITISCTQPHSLTTSNVAKTVYCAGDSLSIPFTFTGTFTPSNRFTAQLSDANGNFTSPQTIGFIEGALGTHVKTQLPTNLIKGTGYKVRILSSDPVVVGTVSSTFEVKNIPVTPTDLIGKTTVCPNEKDLPYSVSPVADITHYKWTFASTVLVASSVPDSSSIIVSSWPSATTLSVQAVNSCGNSAPLNRSINMISGGQAPTISITASKDNFCEGDSVLFSSIVSNIGNNPVYYWKINGEQITINSSTFLSTLIKNGDTVSATVVSEGSCLLADSVQSNKLVMTVKEVVYPDVTIKGSTRFCEGTMANFVASTLNKGTNPILKWYVNSQLAETRTDTLFSSYALKNNDTLWATLESNVLCARPSLVVSPKIILQIKPSVTASLLLTGSITSCKGEHMGFIATPQGGSRTPFYTWYVNGSPQQENASNFSSRVLSTGDKIKVTMNNTEECASTALVESNTLLVSVLDTVNPTLSIQGDTLFCKGQILSFSTSTANGGSRPRFSWSLDGTAISDTTSSISLSDLNSGKHTLVSYLESNATCPRPNKVAKQLTFTIKDSLSIQALITGDTVACKGSMATFYLKNALPTTDIQYEWNLNNQPVANGEIFSSNSLAQNDKISLTVRTEEKCATASSYSSTILTVDVLQVTEPIVTIKASKQEICEGEFITYTASIEHLGTNPSYAWYKDNTQIPFSHADTLKASPAPASFIEFEFKTTLSCGDYRTTKYPTPSITFLEPPVLQALSGPSVYCAQDSNLLFTTDLFPNAIYTWSYPPYASAQPNGNKIYLGLQGNVQTDSLKVSVSNSCGLGNTLSLLLNPQNCSTLFIPNTILAGSNDGNELWQIRGLETNEEVKVMVFNRWGNKVFQTKGYTSPWDGTFNGKLLPTGTYYYLIERVKDKPLTGTLTIIH